MFLPPMGKRKGDWECRFMDFFAAELEKLAATPFAVWGELAILKEADNCEQALQAMSKSNQLEHYLLVKELSPYAYQIIPRCPDEDWLEKKQWLDDALQKARDEKNKGMEERILVEQLRREGKPDESEGPTERNSILQQLSRLNPIRAEGIKGDTEGYVHLKKLNLSHE